MLFCSISFVLIIYFLIQFLCFILSSHYLSKPKCLNIIFRLFYSISSGIGSPVLGGLFTVIHGGRFSLVFTKFMIDSLFSTGSLSHMYTSLRGSFKVYFSESAGRPAPKQVSWQRLSLGSTFQ